MTSKPRKTLKTPQVTRRFTVAIWTLSVLFILGKNISGEKVQSGPTSFVCIILRSYICGSKKTDHPRSRYAAVIDYNERTTRADGAVALIANGNKYTWDAYSLSFKVATCIFSWDEYNTFDIFIYLVTFDGNINRVFVPLLHLHCAPFPPFR